MEIVFLLIGLVVGAVAAFAVLKARGEAAFQQGKAEAGIETASLQGKLQGVEQRLAEAQAQARRVEEQAAALQKQLTAESSLRAAAEEKAARIPALEAERAEVVARVAALQKDVANFQAENAKLQTTLDEERKQSGEKLAVLNEAREALTHQFKTIAGEILDDKSKKFTEQNKLNLDGLLKPLGEKIKEFEKKVEDTYDKESKQRFALEGEIKRLQELNQQISKDALNLTNALKGQAKTQGNWGEFILERVLEKSGLTKGREYEVQVSLQTDDGKRYQPDVVIHLPDARHVVVDSKVSIVAYERYCATEDEAERRQALKEHVASVRKHVADLSAKRYQDLYQLNSLDLVLLFVPVEPAFLMAAQADDRLFNDAFEKNIIIVSPSTLLGMLRTVASVWNQARQEKNVLEIAEQAGRLYDKFVGFVDDLEDIGKKLQATQKAYEGAQNKLVSGRGNLITSAEKVRKLGAKTSKALPAGLAEVEAEGDEEPRVPSLT